MITVIASVVKTDTKEAPSHQSMASNLPEASTEAIDVEGKVTQMPLNPAGHREVFAYRVHEIQCGWRPGDFPYKAFELPSQHELFR